MNNLETVSTQEVSLSSSQALDQIIGEIPQFVAGTNWTASPLFGGIESSVARLVSADGRSIVVKYTLKRFTSNDNDPDLDFLDLYGQERLLANWCAERGVPVARQLSVFLSKAGLPVILMDYVPNDGSAPSQLALGRLLAQVHRLCWDGMGTVAMRGQDTATAMCDLTYHRLELIRARSGRELPALSRETFFSMLGPISESRNILHMDLRPANVLCRQGQPVALIDWANALVGAPVVELARMFEYDLVDDQFLRGYNQPDLLDSLHTSVGLACRLYTAVMMCVLFMFEVPDHTAAKERLERLATLLRSISRCSSQ